MKRFYENMKSRLLNKKERRIRSFTTQDNRLRFSEQVTDDKEIYSTERKIERLEVDNVQYYDTIEDLFDIDATLDCLYCNFDDYLTFSDDGKRVKIDPFFTESDFQYDKIVVVKEDEKKGTHDIKGIIVDLKKDDDFIEAYSEGVVCDLSKSKRFLEAISNIGDDFDANKWIHLIDEDELKNLIEKFSSKVSAGAELIPQGIYVIVNSRIYYLTAEEYKDYYEWDSTMFKLSSTPGINQLNANLLKNESQVLRTIQTLLYSKCFNNKKYLDLNDESSIGTDPQTFLENLLANDPQTYEFLESELKPVEKTK